jgi:ABC-type Fe3+ transport system substrate-binding protein
MSPNGSSRTRAPWTIAPLVAIVQALLLICAATASATTLVEKARAEGRVVWLTTHILGEVALPLAAAFKATHGIEVVVQRTTPRQTADRLVQAARTPRTAIDVVDGRSAIPHLKRAGFLSPLAPETLALLPPHLVDRDGYWVASNVYLHAIAVNTERVAPAQRPRTLDDVLRPEWRGRIAWSGQATLSGGAGFIGTQLRDKGEAAGRAFLGQLAGQQISTFDVPSRQIVEMLIAGEFDIALQVYAHQASISAGRGAPILWLPLEPLTGSVSAIAIARQARHPYAARLFLEFILSRQGQEIFREADQIPASPDVAPKDASLRPAATPPRTVHFRPEEVEAEMPGWLQIQGALLQR